MIIELSEQEQLRRQSLKALRELGINPYPAARFEVNATAQEIAQNFDAEKGNYQEVAIAGRIMSRRIMGSASFFELQDSTGRIQVYIMWNRDFLPMFILSHWHLMIILLFGKLPRSEQRSDC